MTRTREYKWFLRYLADDAIVTLAYLTEKEALREGERVRRQQDTLVEIWKAEFQQSMLPISATTTK